MDENHIHQHATSHVLNPEQQLPWNSHEPPPVSVVTSNHNFSQSNAVSIHQQPVLQMKLPRSVQTPITTSRPPPSMQPLQLIRWAQRPKFATSFWEEEGTLCYQVDANSICVARRQDNDMINGTKLLNVAGMSRGKRDGILKNEESRVVVKVGPMHLKGVWQNQSLPLQRVRPNQTKITKELPHEFERYEYKDVLSFEANVFSQTAPASKASELFPTQSQVNRDATTSATTTPMSNMATCYFTTPNAVSQSRRASPVTHHVYPSYNDSNSSTSNSSTMSHQAPVNHFLIQESNDKHCMLGFQGSPVSIVPLATPGSAASVTPTLKNYEFQSAAAQFQQLNADEMLLSAAVVPQHQRQQQQHYHSPHPVQQQQFIPYSTPLDEVSSSSFMYTPPLSANNSTPPTPADPSATFQFELHSLHHQRNVSQHTQNNTFVARTFPQQYQQQQHQQVHDINLFDF
ncbi:hypothetical protein MAM1_0034d02565 [Mucor ambiguus]|uniref:HTH APSES-type domain-containing protein n=1 Tax=Mucor ambiguus TaxID=91626 RepID=A0A0C9M7S7_9FUNG|nr:hypothetical protein MAM1_0034d02565 [Mucor ambiguus]